MQSFRGLSRLFRVQRTSGHSGGHTNSHTPKDSHTPDQGHANHGHDDHGHDSHGDHPHISGYKFHPHVADKFHLYAGGLLIASATFWILYRCSRDWKEFFQPIHVLGPIEVKIKVPEPGLKTEGQEFTWKKSPKEE